MCAQLDLAVTPGVIKMVRPPTCQPQLYLKVAFLNITVFLTLLIIRENEFL